MGKNHRKSINLHHHYSAVKFYTDKIEMRDDSTRLPRNDAGGKNLTQLAKVINNKAREGC